MFLLRYTAQEFNDGTLRLYEKGQSQTRWLIVGRHMDMGTDGGLEAVGIRIASGVRFAYRKDRNRREEVKK